MQNICTLMTDSVRERLCPWHYGSNSRRLGMAALTITSPLIVRLKGVAEDFQNRCQQMAEFQPIPKILKKGHKILVLLTKHAIYRNLLAIVISMFLHSLDLIYLQCQFLLSCISRQCPYLVVRGAGSQKGQQASPSCLRPMVLTDCLLWPMVINCVLMTLHSQIQYSIDKLL